MAESPIANEFNRPAGWRFAFEGVNLREVPDSIGPTKYASAKNIRATSERAIQTRPGYSLVFSTTNIPITDIGSYTVLGTDDKPRLLVRNTSNQIWDDTGTLVVNLSGLNGSGVWMLPFRPGESPQSWMYVAGLGDYQKISAPASPTLAYKVGIAEPQVQVEAAYIGTDYIIISGLAATWTPGGTMSAPADGNRTADTAGTILSDPIISTRRYITEIAGSLPPYSAGQLVSFNGGPLTLVEDVYPAAATLTILAIRYDSGSTGLCTIQVNQAPIGSGAATDFLGTLRRGSVIKFTSTSEYALVLSTVTGLDGSLCINVNVANTYAVSDTFTGVSAFQVDYSPAAPSDSLRSPIIVANTTGAGVGTLSQTISPSPFAVATGVGFPQNDDYIHVSVQVSDPTLLIEIQIRFSVGTGASPNFTQDYYYTSIQPSQLAGVVANTETQLNAALSQLTQSTVPQGTALPTQTPPGQLQWLELLIPISSLIRVSNDQTLTLQDCNGIQFIFNCTAAMTVCAFGSFWIGRGGQPDIGDTGAEYKYRVVPRNSATGVQGNPSPPMRYGVRPRRESVQVNLISGTYDPQIDTWDIFRYGGSVDSYRYVGSAPSTATTFLDDIFDTGVLGGSLMETDNFEPWTSIDVPFRVTIGGAISASIAGPFLTLSGLTTWPSTITRWLPGTLVQTGGHTAYTLRSRPVALSSTSYLFEFEECIETDALSGIAYFWILEPKVARNPNPYIFGPDASGTFFGCGDNLRPGTVSMTKAGKPDSAPDKYNLDLCPPSEPLIGGVIKGGVSLVSSTDRWWALYPSFGSNKRYTPIEQSVGRGLIAPYAVDTDGVLVYFWAKDGICVTAGGPFESLTNDDLYPIFPHEGVPGVNITRFGLTYYAPDYSRAATFRLRKVKTYLFADYQDTDGNPRTLICDLRTKGWSQDVYGDIIKTHYGPRQQSGTLTATPVGSYVGMYMADAAGKVYKEQDCTTDVSAHIPCHVGTFEWNGGDERMQPLWGDQYIDLVPQSQVTVTPTTLGANAATATVIAASGNRTFAPISILGGELNKFMGMLIEWSD